MCGFEGLNQISGADDFHPEPTNQLDRTAVDARDVWDSAPRGVIHRDTPVTAKDASQAVHHLPLGAVDAPWYGRQRIKTVSLDRGHQRLWRPMCGDKINPSPGRESLFGQSEDAICEWVAQAE